MPGVGGDRSITELSGNHQTPETGPTEKRKRAHQPAIADALKFSVPAGDGQPDLDVDIVVDRECHPADVDFESGASSGGKTGQVRQRLCRSARRVGVDVGPGCNIQKYVLESSLRARRIRLRGPLLGPRRSDSNSCQQSDKANTRSSATSHWDFSFPSERCNDLVSSVLSPPRLARWCRLRTAGAQGSMPFDAWVNQVFALAIAPGASEASISRSLTS